LEEIKSVNDYISSYLRKKHFGIVYFKLTISVTLFLPCDMLVHIDPQLGKPFISFFHDAPRVILSQIWRVCRGRNNL